MLLFTILSFTGSSAWLAMPQNKKKQHHHDIEFQIQSFSVRSQLVIISISFRGAKDVYDYNFFKFTMFLSMLSNSGTLVSTA
jgi:energy-converting hydrogenase Eha subunit H